MKSTRSRQTAKWHHELIRWWVLNDMPRTCELRYAGCMGRFGLALAHSLKRREIHTREQYFEVVAACQKCHERLDLKMSHAEMQTAVKAVIAGRERIAA